MPNILYGPDAVQFVEQAEGPLSPIEQTIVMDEGYADGPYRDTKGIPTTGVGQTGEFANMTAKEAIGVKTQEAKSMISGFDLLSPELQAQLVSANYRGDLGQSPKARALLNAGKFSEAADEFLNNDEYMNTPNVGIRNRMERVANAMRQEGATKQAEQDFNTANTPVTNDATSVSMAKVSDSVVPTKGDTKIMELERRNTAKQKDIETKAYTKKLKLGGVTDAEIAMLDMGMDAYMRTDINNAGAKADEFLAAQSKFQEVEASINGTDDKALFDVDTTGGYLGNTLLSTVNTVGKIYGGLVSLPHEIRGALNLVGISEEDIKMYGQIQGRSEAVWSDEEYDWFKANQDVITDIKDAEEAFQTSEVIDDITGFLGKYVNQELTTEFVDEGAGIFNDAMAGKLSAGEIASGLGDLFSGNKGAIGQATIESLPYMLTAAYSMPMTMASGWASNQREAIKTYQANNDGAMPVESDLAKLSALTAAQALVDFMGDRLVSGGAANLTKTVKAITGKQVGSKSVAAVTGRVVESAAGEFVAEASADALGQLAGTAGEGEVDLGQSVGTGLLGAGSGGATAGAIEVPQLGAKAGKATAKAASTVAEKTVDKAKDVKANAAYSKAVKANDTSVLPSKEDANYDAVKEIDARTRILEQGKITPEQAAENLAEIQNIGAEVVKEYLDLKAEYDKSTEEGQEALVPELNALIGQVTEIKSLQARAKDTTTPKNLQTQANNLATATTNSANVQAAAQQVFGSMASSPDAIPVKVIQDILDNKSIKLTKFQRARMEANLRTRSGEANLTSVNKEIIKGSKRNMGVRDYVANTLTAVDAGDMETATALIKGLETFRKGHVAKLRKGGHSKNFVTDVTNEISYMSSALAEMRTAVGTTEVNNKDTKDDIPTNNTGDSATERTERGGVTLTRKKGKEALGAKDQAKSDKANKFIGFGNAGSSTEQYAKDWGDKANTGEYTSDDTVFVSVNGGKANGLTTNSPTLVEVQKAVDAGATIVADVAGTGTGQRDSSYNKYGEGRLARVLGQVGYVETEEGSGVWTPKTTTPTAEAEQQVEAPSSTVAANAEEEVVTEPTTLSPIAKALPEAEVLPEDAEVTAEFLHIDALVDEVYINSAEGITYDETLAAITERFGSELANKVSASLDQETAEAQGTLGEQITKSDSVTPEGETEYSVDLDAVDKYTERITDLAISAGISKHSAHLNDAIEDITAAIRDGSSVKLALTEIVPEYTGKPVKRINASIRKLQKDIKRAPSNVDDGMTVEERKSWLQKVNWIKEFLTATNPDNILQSAPNVFEQSTTVAQIEEYMGRELTGAEEAQLKDYQLRRKGLSTAMDKVFNPDAYTDDMSLGEIAGYTTYKQGNKKKGIKKGDKRAILKAPKYNDMMQYLAVDGELRTGVREAIMAVAYNWIATSAGDTLYNEDSVMNTILGENNADAYVAPTVKGILQGIGSTRTAVLQSIGKDIIGTLGVTGTRNAPGNVDTALETSLGMFTLEVLKEAGVVKENQLTKDQVARLNLFAPEDSEVSLNLRFIKATTNKEGELHAKLNMVGELAKESRQAARSTDSPAMMDQMFGITSRKVFPEFSKPTTVATKVIGTDRNVPRKTQEGLAVQNAREHYLKGDLTAMAKVMEGDDKDSFMELLGVRDVDTVHVSKRKAQESANHNAKRVWDNFNEFYENNLEVGLDKPHYYTQNVWKNGRFGIAQNMVNPQGDKIHRAFIKQKGWDVQLDPYNKKHMEQFWSAMEEELGFDYKKWQSKAIKPPYKSGVPAGIQAAADIVRGFLETDSFQEGDVATLSRFIREELKGKENTAMLKLDAITHIARYDMAVAAGTTFQSEMFIEIDGKTSGIIISLIEYGAAVTGVDLLELLGMGGIYGEGDITNFNEYKDAGNLDAYNKLAKVWMKAIRATGMTPATTAMFKLFGLVDSEGKAIEKAERGLAKNPLMVIFYGSGIKAVKSSLGSAFTENVIDLIEKAGQEQDLDAYNALRTELNKIEVNALPLITDPAQILETELSYATTQNLEAKVGDLFGTTALETVEAQYPEYMSRRDEVRDVFDSMYRRHAVLREKLIAVRKAELVAEGKLTNIEDMAKHEYKAIDERIMAVGPHFHSHATKGGDVSESINPSKVSSELDSTTTVEAKYKNGENKSSQGIRLVPASPGVGAGSMGIHSADGSQMLYVYEDDIDSIGVHDANLIGITDAEALGKIQNKAFETVTRETNLLVEALKAFQNSNNTYRKIIAEDGLNGKELEAAALKVGDKVIEASETRTRVNNLVSSAKEAVKVRDDMWKEVRYVHQYADHNGISAHESNTNKWERFKYVKSGDAKSIAKETAEDVVDASGSTQGFDANEATNAGNYDNSVDVDLTNVSAVFDSLPTSGGKQENATHKATLRDMVQGLTTKLSEPFGFHMREKQDVPNYGVATQSDIYLTNLANGAPETSSLLAQGIRMSSEEIMAHELNHLVFVEGFKTDSRYRRQFERIFNAVKAQATPEVLLANPGNATQAELDGAQATFDYIFNNKDGKALEEFGAFATTNERMIDFVNGIELKPEPWLKGENPYEIMVNVLTRIVDGFNGRILNLKDVSNDKKLFALMDGMNRITGKKQEGIIGMAQSAAIMAGGLLQAPSALITASARKLANVPVFKDSRSATVRHLSEAIRSKEGATKINKALLDHLEELRDIATENKYGWFQHTADEMIGRTVNNETFRDMARTSKVILDMARKRAKDAMTKHITKEFKTPVTEDEWTAMNKVIVKLDLDTVSDLGFEKLGEMLTNTNALQNEIDGLEAVLKSFNNYNFYRRHSENLGYFMNTSESLEDVALLNAHNIARGYGDNKMRVNETTANRVEPIINKLASLYGIKYADDVHRNAVADLMSRDMDGVNAVFDAHHTMKEGAKQQFASTKEHDTLTIKGWTKEEYRDSTGFEIAPLDMKEELESQGFIMKGKVARDNNDPVKTDMYMFIAPDGALAPYMAQIASLTSNVAKGADTITVESQWGSETPYESSLVDNVMIEKGKQAALAQMHLNPVSPKPADNKMIPIISPKGTIVGWRYMMTEANRDALLQKDNNVANVLGAMAGNIVDKVNTPKVNKELVVAAKAQYDADLAKGRGNAYVEISNDAEGDLLEIWRRMPQAMQDDVLAEFGKPAMMVRSDLVDQMFGYRKPSVTELFAKDPTARRYWEHMVVQTMQRFLPKNTVQKVRKAENVLQALVQETKDIVVVRSIVVPLFNVFSNTMFLMLQGIDPVTAIKGQVEAYVAGNRLVTDIRARDELSIQLARRSNSATRTAELTAELAQLNRRIEINPTNASYQAGLMPSVVDDAEADVNISNSLRGQTQRKVSAAIDSKLGRMPAMVPDAVKGILGLPDSTAYRTMNNFVRNSDFIARHVVANHWAKEKAKETGKAVTDKDMNDIYAEATELFVNFDAPTHRGTQYANDIGIAWFTKYLFRVNRAVVRTVFSRPVKVALAILAMNFTGFNAFTDTPIGSAFIAGRNPLSALGDPISALISALGLTVPGHVLV